MRITGTKKLLIILFAVICAVAAGIGVLYAKPSQAYADAAPESAAETEAPVDIPDGEESADSEQKQYDGKYDEIEMHTLADSMGIDFDALNFYARTNEISVDALSEIYAERGEELKQSISQFYELYSAGELTYTGEKNIEEEDWFLPPDAASSYYWIMQPGASFRSSCTASKPITNETGLWGSSMYTFGEYTQFIGGKKWLEAGRAFSYWWVWLEPGETFSMSVYSAYAHRSVTTRAENASQFFEDYLTYQNPKFYTGSGSYGGWFVQGTDGVWRDDYGVYKGAKTLQEYQEEYNSDIQPTNEFLSASSLTNAAGGTSTLRISGDAPSGVYTLQYYIPRNNTSAAYFGAGSGSLSEYSASDPRYWSGYDPSHVYGSKQPTYYYEFKIIVNRSSIEKPVMKFDDGVNSDRTKREVTYNGEAQTIAFEGDWGSGLSTATAYEYSDPLTGGTGRYYRNTVASNVYTWYQLEETTNKEYKWSGTAWQEYNGSAWVDTTSTLINTAPPPIPNRALNITLTARSARGSGTQSDMVYSATECGKYKILVSPFNKWTDGTSTTLAYEFIINKIKLQRPSLIMEDGVTDNLKYVNDNEGPQFISISPVLSKFMNINMGGLAQYNWSSDGLITLTGNQQGDYDIEVSLKNTNNTNIEWATPGDNGSVTDAMKFRLTIGPMKITTPYVIEDKGVTGNVKEITYSGGDEYMSLMFVRTDRMDVDCGALNGTVADNRLSVPAKESGAYKITITPHERYCWQDGTRTTLEFTFIINPMKISAPIFDEPDADGRKKTVVYYGEKDENGYDWFETLTFQNAYQARVKWNTAGNIGQYTWGDSELKLSATSAGISTVYFTCLPNYQWDDTVEKDPDNPERTVSYTLEIKRKPLDLPQLIKDSEDQLAEFPTDYRKEVPFDFQTHNIYIKIGEADSIFVTQGSALTHEWGVNGDPYLVKFTATDAGNHSIRLRPTGNYCWNDANQTYDFIDYVFRIAPISLPALGMEIEQTVGGISQWMPVPDYKTGAQLNYTGQPQRARIGKLVAEGEEINSRVSYDPNWHHYMIVDSANNPILAADYDKYGITVTEGNGLLSFSAERAGEYYIRVDLNNNNYTWDQADQADGTSISYKFTVLPGGIPNPIIYADGCAGNDINGKIESDKISGVYDQHDFTLAISLADEYKDLIKVDVETLGNDMTYAGWENGILTLKAISTGDHTVILTVTSPNHVWGADVEDFRFTIHVAFAPVSGLEFYFITEDGDELAIGEPDLKNGDSVTKDLTFNEKAQVIYVKRTRTEGLIPTGFDEQFEYSIKSVSLHADYEVEMTVVGYDDTELRLSVLDAGTYTLTIQPKKDYCWQDSQESKAAVTLTVNVGRLTVKTPELNDDGGQIVNGTTKQITYNLGEIPINIELFSNPKAFKVYETEGWIKVGDPTYTTGMTDPVIDEENHVMTAKATHTGQYRLTVVLDNINNYQWDPQKTDDNCTFYLQIDKLGVEFPEAYLIDSSKIPTDPGYQNASDGEKISVSPYTASVTYNGKQHTVYIVGATIQGGAFDVKFSANTQANILSTSGEILDGNNKIVAYRLDATNVDVYGITVKFKTDDYLWKDNNGSEERSIEVSIGKKTIAVPKFKEEPNLTPVNDTLTVEHTFNKDILTYVITGCDFGELNGTINSDGTLAAGAVFEFMNVRVSSDATAGYTGITFTTLYAEDGTTVIGYEVNMKTLGSPNDPTYASVSVNYVIEFYIDGDNTQWNTAIDDAAPKKFKISVIKAKVDLPKIIMSQSDKVNDFTKAVTYTGDRWVDVLKLVGVDENFMRYSLALPGEMSDVYDPSVDKGTLIVSTDAPAKTYTVVVSLLDTDNLEWVTDGSTDDLNYCLIVKPYTVALPSIVVESGSTASADGIVGLTKTVTYNYADRTLKIRGFWEDASDRWMTRAVTSAKSFDDEEYIQNYFWDTTNPGAITPPGTEEQAKYHDIMCGLLTYTAKNAGTYTVTFTLTSNAVWADGTNTPVDIKLIIKKLEYDTPYIINDGTGAGSIVGETKSFTYELDGSGNPVERNIKIADFTNGTYPDVVFDNKSGEIMELVSYDPVNAAQSDIAPVSGSDYEFTATKANTYAITYKIKDFENTRWKYADKETITFYFVINKKVLKNPTPVNTYLLDNEVLKNGVLTVDYDTRMHSFMLENIVESPFTDNGGVFTSYYLSYQDITSDPDAKDTLTLKWYSEISDAIGNNKVSDIYGATYDGTKKDWLINKNNVLVFGTTLPGTYEVKVSLVDSNNMEFEGGSVDPLTFTLKINKLVHEAPRKAQDVPTSQQYTGKQDIEFRIRDMFNGVEKDGGPTVGFEYEQFSIVYTDRDGTDSTLTNTLFTKSWYAGELSLLFKDVGKYTVKVWINPLVKDFVEWTAGDPDVYTDGSGNTCKDIVFYVTERTLGVDFTFDCTNDEQRQALLKQGSTEWEISSAVTPTVRISNLVSSDGTAAGVDKNLIFRFYYMPAGGTYPTDVMDSTGMYPYEVKLTNRPEIAIIKADNGTFYCDIQLPEILHGQGVIQKGNYVLHVEQIYDELNPGDTPTASDVVPTNCKYLLPGNTPLYPGNTPQLPLNTVDKNFTVIADKAPFEENLLQWQYATDDNPSVFTFVQDGMGGSANNRFVLPYLEDGRSYIIGLTLTSKGLQGDPNHDNYPNTDPDYKVALNYWWVKQDGNLGGDTTANAAGNYAVTVTISAYDSSRYSFATKTYTFYYSIGAAKYDLSGLRWDYDGSTPFEFDGNAKSVNVVGTLPAGLSIKGYKTVCATYPVSNSNNNTQTYAGTYTTTVEFAVSSSNYVLPEQSKSDSYLGTFSWSVTWTINKQHIVVEWMSGERESDGSIIKYAAPKVDGVHANKFEYSYRKWDPNANGGAGDWIVVSSITRGPNQSPVKYEVTAKLKNGNNHTNPAADYDRSYTFEFLGEPNPMEYEFGGNDKTIFNHIEINGKTDSSYVYSGSPVDIKNIIDVDTTGGLIDNGTIKVLTFVYSTVNPNMPLTTPPSKIGSYIVKVLLSYSGTTEDYVLSEEVFNFSIVKADFKDESFEWHYTHGEGESAVDAVWKEDQGKWINVATGEEVKIIYDGYGHSVKLISTDPNVTVNNSGATNISAGDYTTQAFFNFDGNLYNAPTVANTFDWTIEKKFLDLSLIKWSDEEQFVYTRANGKEKEFTMEVVNLPEELQQYAHYVTSYYVGTQLPVGTENKGTKAGRYDTTFSFSDMSDEFLSNYTVGEFPSGFDTRITWEIATREIEIPSDDGSWTTFDGAIHNLINVFGIDVDWDEYFTIAVSYTPADGGASAEYVKGLSEYGNRYFAFDAGKYELTLSLRPELNNTAVEAINVCWKGAIVTYSTGADLVDKTVSLTVNKMQLSVSGWDSKKEDGATDKCENSTVILDQTNVTPSKFIDYLFYRGHGLTDLSALTPVDLDVILESAGKEDFTIVPIIKAAFRGNVDLTVSSNHEFTTPEINESNSITVNGKPYIYGYTVNGNFSYVQTDEDGIPYVIYTGEPITFNLYNWDSYYVNHLDVWNGTIDDLTQTDVGKYSIKLLLKNDEKGPRIWGKTADNKIDRKSLTLEFEIRYLYLDLPEMPDEVTYSGREIDIIRQSVDEATFNKLMEQYGAIFDSEGNVTGFKYVEITGDKGTSIGSYRLYMKIKPEYSISVRWNDGTPAGLADTYSFEWNINPIYLIKPELNSGVYIVYDGAEHSVFEVLKGYSSSGLSDELLKLMQNARIPGEGSRSVNAGDFKATFSLPNGNYAWVDENGTPTGDSDSVVISWSIQKCVITLSTGISWNYEESFEYTRNNGQAFAHKVELVGLPDEIKDFVSYRTDGFAGNTASSVGKHKTTVILSLGTLSPDNYTIDELPADLLELEWEITERKFTLPKYEEGSWDKFDGQMHDLMVLLGYGEDWFNYFDVEVLYDPDGGENFGVYDVSKDPNTGYSIYNGYYVGSYKLSISLKANINTDTSSSIFWVDENGDPIFDTQVCIIKCGKLIIELNAEDWIGDRELSEVDPAVLAGMNLPESVKDLLEYIVYDAEDPTKTPVNKEDITDGTTYRIEFVVKKGYEIGIEIIGATYVEFGNYNFGSQSVRWMPLPTLEDYSIEFTGEDITFKINDWDNLYNISSADRLNLRNEIPSVNIPNSTTKFAYILEGEKGLTKKARGEYSITFRFINGVNLSWYDSTKYKVNSSGILTDLSDTPVADTESLIRRTSYKLSFEITEASVPAFDESDLDNFINEIIYNGTEQDIRDFETNADIFAALKEKYGSLITISGAKGTDADDGYELVISLTDPDSSYWETGKTQTRTEVMGDYEYTYVNEGGKWTVKLLHKESGAEYDGDYTLDGVVYEYEYVMDYVQLSTSVVDGNTVIGAEYLDADGKVKADAPDKDLILVDEDGKAVRFVKNGSEYEVDPDGDYIAKYVLDTDGNRQRRQEYVVNYSAYYSKLADNALNSSVKDPLLKADGTPVTDYIFENAGKYELRRYEVEFDGTDYLFTLDDAGNPKFTVLDGDCVLVKNGGNVVTYAPDGDGFKEDADGKFVGVYETDDNNDPVMRDVIARDENGNPVIDNKNSKITIAEPVKGYDEYTFGWSILRKGLDTPTVDADNPVPFTGNPVKLADSEGLDGYDSDIMEITQNGTATDVGTYTAVIKLKDLDNYYWNANPDQDYVTVVWEIAKGTLDLSKVTWKFSWDTEKGDPEYARKDGKAQIYWAELDGIPDAIKNNVQYTTNGKVGAYAGRDAGKYVTSYKFVGINEDNYESIIWPANLEESVTWYIKRHKLDLPELDTSKPWVVFDDGVHDLRNLLKLPEDWEEYCDVKVEYSADFSAEGYVAYEGYDNGDGLKWYLAHGAGAYRFTIEIKSGINVNASNPSVVWNDGSADDGNTEPGTPETITFILNAIAKEEEENADEPVIDLNDPEAVQYVEGDEESDGGEQTPPEAEEPAPEPPKTPGEGDIADPDPDYSEDDKWIDEIQQITMNVDKLRVTATNWTGADAAARLALDYSRYEDAAKVEEIIKAVLKYKYYDTLGKEVSTVDMKAGCTYFVHPELDGKYGDYIEIEYKDGVKKSYDFSLDFTDDKPYDEIDLPEGIEPGSKYTVILDSKVYTGLDIEFVIEFLAQHQGVLQIVASESDSLIQKNAGKYRVTVCFQDEIKACWKGQANHDRTAITFEFEITQKEISLGGTTGLGEIAYTGKEIDINAILKELDFGGYVIVEYGSEDKRTDVGEYKVTIRLNPEYGDNVKWSSDTQLNADGRTVTLVWHITQATINGTWNELGRLTLESESYVGGTEGKIEYKYYTDAELTQEVSGTSLKAGTKYWVKAILLDTVNLKWADGFKDVHEFTLEVELILLPKPELIFDTQEYTGQEITFNILNPNQYTGHIEIVEGELTQQEIGVYTVVIRLVGDGAVWDTGSTDDVTLTFEITQTVISGEWIEGAGVMDLTSAYRGSYAGIVEYVYTDSDGNVISKANLVKGETYTVTVTLKDTEHFRWADGQELTQTFTFTAEIVVVPKLSLKESEVFYTGEAITAVIVDYEKYRDNLQSVRLSYTEAGTYEIRLRLKGAAEWEAGISGELVLTFTIKKVVLKGTWTDEGRIEFEENSYKGDYAEVVEYIYKDVNGNIVSASELREGEVYTATVRLKEGKGANFDDSELVKEYEFTYKSVKKGISWWVILLIIIAIILIILIIVVIIYTQRKRKRLREEALQEEQYEASGAYGDEYDSEYDYGNADYNADNAGATDYGADGATDFPSDIPSDGTDTF